MLEFYEAYRDYDDMMDHDRGAPRRPVPDAPGQGRISVRRRRRSRSSGRSSGSSSWTPCRRTAAWPPEKFDDPAAIIKSAETAGPREKAARPTARRSDIIFDKHVKHHLVQPTFIINPPKEVSPLAKAAKDTPARRPGSS